MKLYKIENLFKVYGEGTAKVVALNKVNLEIEQGKIIVILGASGSGKSTLLNILGCMDTPTDGKIMFGDTDITTLNQKSKTEFRRKNIGFVFQNYNLLPDLTALENVEFSTELSGIPNSKAKEALMLVGLGERLNNFPKQLSGGEQQRVSIARAVAKNPQVLLCDEPTGALDVKNGIIVLDLLTKINRQNNTSIILITHNQSIAKIADYVITLKNGEIESAEKNSPLAVSEVQW